MPKRRTAEAVIAVLHMSPALTWLTLGAWLLVLALGVFSWPGENVVEELPDGFEFVPAANTRDWELPLVRELVRGYDACSEAEQYRRRVELGLLGVGSRLASEQPAESLPVLGGHGSAGVYDWADDYGDAA
jgi:hypothetical protein